MHEGVPATWGPGRGENFRGVLLWQKVQPSPAPSVRENRKESRPRIRPPSSSAAGRPPNSKCATPRTPMRKNTPANHFGRPYNNTCPVLLSSPCCLGGTISTGFKIQHLATPRHHGPRAPFPRALQHNQGLSFQRAQLPFRQLKSQVFPVALAVTPTTRCSQDPSTPQAALFRKPRLLRCLGRSGPLRTVPQTQPASDPTRNRGRGSINNRTQRQSNRCSSSQGECKCKQVAKAQK